MDFLQELTEITDMNYKTLFRVFSPVRRGFFACSAAWAHSEAGMNHGADSKIEIMECWSNRKVISGGTFSICR